MTDKNQEGVEENLDLPEVEEGQEDTTDWKAEALKLREKAIKQRERTKELKEQLKGLSSEEKSKSKPADKSNELDYSEKAFLLASGIKGSDEMTLVKEFMSSTGKTLDEVLENKYFNAELKELREARASSEAVPKGTKRSASNSRDSEDYWSKKYENGTPLTDIPEEMQMKVIQNKLKVDKDNSMFASTAVIGG